MKDEKKVPFFFHGILIGRYEDEQDAELFGYKLFTRGFNTFKKESGESVKGTLAMVPESEIKALDIIEGFPEFYVRIQLPIVTDSGAVITAWCYQQAEDWVSDMTSDMLSNAQK